MGRDQTTPSFFMDQTQALTLLTLIALMVSAIVFTRRRWKKQKQRLLLPPGHMGLPFLGETLNFYKAQQNNRLFEDFVQHRRRKHGDVFKTRLMGEPTVVISGAVGNRFVFSNEFKLLVSSWPSTAVRLIGEQSIMQAQGEMHRRLRSAVLASLRGPALEALVPAMERAVEDHFEEQWRGRETVRLFSCVKRLTFSAVFGCLLGVDAGEVGGERFLELFETVLGGIFAAPVNLPGCRYWRAKRARVEIGKILVELVRRRRGEMGGQGLLLGRLMDLEWEGDGNEVVDNVVLLVFAAHDTTSFVIAMMCRLLAHHPECYARLVRGMFSRQI